MAANIQAYLENLKQPWGQIYYDILFDQLQDIKGKRVLDFGSGFGLVANHLAHENQVLAVEPNEEMVALRTQDYPYQQLVGSLDQLESFEDASFDVILCHNVLEYVENRKAVLKAFIRLLKPGGLLSIVKHNEVGRVLQTVVFENDTQKALDLLAGQDLETHSMGLAQAYDLDAVIENLALEIKTTKESVSFMPCRIIASKTKRDGESLCSRWSWRSAKNPLIGISPSSSIIG